MQWDPWIRTFRRASSPFRWELAITQPSTEPATARADQLLALVSDGVAVIHSDGRLEPCNEAMRALLSKVAGDPIPASLDGLPLDPEDYGDMVAFLASDAVQHRAVVKMRRGHADTVCAVSMLRQGDGVVLVAFQDQSPVREAADRHDRLERWRCLGQLADGLVHDLNNLLGAMLAMVDSISSSAVDESDRTLMHSLRTGTREGARLLQQIGKLMRRHGPTLERFGLADALGDAVRMVHKSARLGGTEVTCSCADVDPFVRGNANAVIHLLCEITARMIGDTRHLHFELGITRLEPARHGLPARRYGTVTILGERLPPELEQLPKVFEGMDQGVLQHVSGSQRNGAGLLAVLMGLLADGAHFGRVDPDPSGGGDGDSPTGLRICLPLVATPALQTRTPDDPQLELPLECTADRDGRAPEEH